MHKENRACTRGEILPRLSLFSLHGHSDERWSDVKYVLPRCRLCFIATTVFWLALTPPGTPRDSLGVRVGWTATPAALCKRRATLAKHKIQARVLTIFRWTATTKPMKWHETWAEGEPAGEADGHAPAEFAAGDLPPGPASLFWANLSFARLTLPWSAFWDESLEDDDDFLECPLKLNGLPSLAFRPPRNLGLRFFSGLALLPSAPLANQLSCTCKLLLAWRASSVLSFRSPAGSADSAASAARACSAAEPLHSSTCSVVAPDDGVVGLSGACGSQSTTGIGISYANKLPPRADRIFCESEGMLWRQQQRG